MRKLNWVFLAILVVSLTLFGGGLHLVHGIQLRRNASKLLDRARRAETDKKPAEAEDALRWYLSLRPDDGPVWAWYARLVDRRDAERAHLEQDYLLYQQALRVEPGDRDLKRGAVDLAMELGRHGDARDLLTDLLEPAPADMPASRLAELEDLCGQCERALKRHDDAAKSFGLAIEHDPGRVDAYDRLARLYRSDLRRAEDGDRMIAAMVAKNPRSGRAHAYRWRYHRELAPPADEKDMARALELAPDDREVLLMAVMDSQQRGDMAAMRTHLEKGNRLDPKDATFALGLARTEIRDSHLDRAEAILRGAFEARPLVGMAFELADVLILEGKIDVPDGADELMGKLRRAGLGDTLVRFLEAEVLYQAKRWTEAIAALETARAVLTAAPELTLRINLMLADCYGRLGSDEQRLEVLRRAAEGRQGEEVARMELVRVLARSGQLDQAITTLTPMAVAGTNPQWRLDVVRLLLEKTIRLPRERRDWNEVERQLAVAEKVMGGAAEPVVLLRLDILAAQDHLEDARSLLARSLEKEPRNLDYRLAMARLSQRQGRPEEALRIIDRAEKDLGPNPRIDLGRLEYWGQVGGDAARAAVAKLAAARGQVPAADRPAFLDRLVTVSIRLGRPDLARQYGREQASLQPEGLAIRLRLFDLALSAGDRDEPARLVDAIRKIEGEDGVNWRFARASLLIDQARRGSAEALEQARHLADEITESRPDSWVGPTLLGEIAELAGSIDQAIASYLKALEHGNMQPSFARRLVALLDRQGRRAEVDRVMEVLKEQGAALAEAMLVQALDALRRRDYDRAISLARQLYPEGSPSAADHLNLGRFYQTAGRSDEAGREFRRAVELGRGVPENWLALVEHLVLAKQLDPARAATEAARKALPPDRATVTMARCALLLGDRERALALVKQATEAEGTADDLATLRVAADVSRRLNRMDAAHSYLERFAASQAATPADRAWANRTQAALWVATNRPGDRDRAMERIERNLAGDPDSVEDQALKAAVLASQSAHRGEAVAILESLGRMNRLGDEQRFLLAQLHLDQGQRAEYEGEMLGLLNRKGTDPRYLAHFVNHWIDRDQLDQADRWLAELKQADPRGRPALELEARLLDLKKRRPALLALLDARGRDVPDEIGVVADLLNQYGFAREAEAAYKAFVARDPRQPERVLALAHFLARKDRAPEAMELLKRAWTTCRPEQVAATALTVYGAPSASPADRSQVTAWMAEAIRKRPDAAPLELKLGVLHYMEGRFDEAEAIFRRAVARDPDDAEALNNLAWELALREPGKVEEALGLINHAIEVHGKSPRLADTRGVVLIQARNIGQALEDLRVARAGDPLNPNYAFHLAWAFLADGKIEEARKVFKDAERLGVDAKYSDPLSRKRLDTLRKELARG